jgi:hypothetical protein
VLFQHYSGDCGPFTRIEVLKPKRRVMDIVYDWLSLGLI